MRIEESFRIAAEPAAVWRWLKNPEAVVPCLPGASLEGPPQDGKLRGKLAVKLGPIAASFAGAGEVAFDDATRTGTLSGKGRDAKTNSDAQGRATFAVAPAGGGGAEVRVAIDYRLTGALAQFGRGGIVAEIVSRLAREFAASLAAKIAAETSDAGTPAAARPEPARLDVGKLVWAALWARLKALFGLGAKT